MLVVILSGVIATLSLKASNGFTKLWPSVALVVGCDAASGKTISGNSVLTGSIKVQGLPCFTTGAASGGLSNILGNSVQAQFVMDDGSMLGIIGTLSDPTEMKITGASIGMAGPCVNATSPVLYSLSGLDKQS